MPTSPLSTILHSTNRNGRKINILCVPTHERFETGLAQTGHNFYAIFNKHTKQWNTTYAPIPVNYTILNGEQIPHWLDFDIVLSHNRFGQYQLLQPLAQYFQIPLITLEHTLPVPNWNSQTRESVRNMKGDIDVFITEYQIDKWGFEKDKCRVITHTVDSEIFKSQNIERKNQILTVANDFINRDWCLNFKQFVSVTRNLPVRIVGDTPGLSRPASSVEELVSEYNSSRIYLNTAHVSPIPTSLLEAMSCGCACVSIKACAIPEFIKHGENGLLASDDVQMKEYCQLLLSDKDFAKKIGDNARKTILTKCSQDRFVSEWNSIFNEASKIVKGNI